eukprot:snap_masked-scaffold_33-processed-gene-1.22-mRNA-1 protein AED:0.44 eAED:0.47 QI:0/-1/0/1/-1/1/1/0/929
MPASPRETEVQSNPPAHTTFIILGATGDLSTRTFLPSLYRIVSSGIYFTPNLPPAEPPQFTIIGLGRNKPILPSNVPKEDSDSDDTLFRKMLSEKLTVGWKKGFMERCFFVQGDLTKKESWNLLEQKRKTIDVAGKTKERVFYVFCGPEKLFGDISERIVIKKGEDVHYIAQKTTSLLLETKVLRNLTKKFGAEKIYRLNLSKGFGQALEKKLQKISSNPFLHHIFQEPGQIQEVKVVAESIKPQKGDLLNHEIINHCLPVILTLFDIPITTGTIKINTSDAQFAQKPALAKSQANGYTYVQLPLEVKCPQLKSVPVRFEASIGAKKNLFEVKILLKDENYIKIHIRPNFQVTLYWNDLKSVLVSEAEDSTSFYFKSYELNLLNTLYLRRNHFNFVPDTEAEQISHLFLPLYKRVLGGKEKYMSLDEDETRPPQAIRGKISRKNSKLFALSEFDQLRPVWANIRKKLLLSNERMEGLITDFANEMKCGLNGKPSSIKMIPSYVTVLPNGTETGGYYSLDLGGTNFRVSKFEFLASKGQFRLVAESKIAIPQDAMVNEEYDEQGTKLFDFLATRIYALVQKEVQADSQVKSIKFGFTFSFPLEQEGIARGKLINWTKGFKVDGTEGQEVVSLLKAGLERMKPENFDVEIEIAALVNDTVGTLVSGKYDDDRAVMGIILGTGTNAAYIEKRGLIKNIPGEDPNTQYPEDDVMAINMEWGAFGDLHHNLLRIRTPADIRIDQQSINPAHQGFEKMMGGMYLGEIVRQILVDLYRSNEIFSNVLNMPSLEPNYKEAGSVSGYLFETRFVSMIEYDMHHDFTGTKEVEKLMGWDSDKITDEDRVFLKEVCGAVVERAARLTGIGIVAVWRHLGLERTPQKGSVGIDGSVFELHPSFQQRLERVLARLNCDPEVFLAKDGSGKGAALVACGVEQM